MGATIRNHKPNYTQAIHGIVEMYTLPIYDLINDKDNLNSQEIDNLRKLFEKMWGRFLIELEQKEVLCERLIRYSETDPVLNG